MRACSPGDVLHEAGKPASFIYFPAGAVISLLATNGSGDGSVAVGFVGNEGVAGLLEAVTNAAPSLRAVVQMGGDVIAISTDRATGALYDDPQVKARFHAYLNLLVTQLGQSSICNIRHSIEQRLARYLLALDSWTEESDLPLTHGYLSQALSATRPMITSTAHALKHKKLITYERGLVRITDRAGLARVACICQQKVEWEMAAFLNLCNFKSHPFWNAVRYRTTANA